MSSVPLLLFSGGLDSTYLLERLLSQGNVETVYVKSSQGDEKIKKELDARDKIMQTLQANSKYHILADHIVDAGERGQKSGGSWKFKQPHIWLFGALEISDARRHSELNIAYVSGDQIMSVLPTVKAAWDALQLLSKHDPIPVKFPLSLYTKQDILGGINHAAYKEVWVCEDPIGKPGMKGLSSCNRCTACNTRDANLFIWERVHGETYAATMRKRIKASNVSALLDPEVLKAA